MFSSFFGGKSSGIDKRTLKNINSTVFHFLEMREIQNFKVYTMDYERTPVVLIQALPQKKLRFSNILEIQIKRYLAEKLGVKIPAVFWRFKTDDSEAPGPEQADYDFEENPAYPQDMPEGEAMLVPPETTIAARASNSHDEHYDVRHLARKGMEVEEISMGEFDEFLKGATKKESPPA